jgi:hypothetical protein
MTTTVQNLIDALKKLPPNALIMAYDEDAESYIDLDYSEIQPCEGFSDGPHRGYVIQAVAVHEPFA